MSDYELQWVLLLLKSYLHHIISRKINYKFSQILIKVEVNFWDNFWDNFYLIEFTIWYVTIAIHIINAEDKLKAPILGISTTELCKPHHKLCKKINRYVRDRVSKASKSSIYFLLFNVTLSLLFKVLIDKPSVLQYRILMLQVYERSVKFRINLWGHCFFKNANQKLQRFLPCKFTRG